jgi:hypothetical protein
MKSFAFYFNYNNHQIKIYRLYSATKESDIREQLFRRFIKVLNNRFTTSIISHRQ